MQRSRRDFIHLTAAGGAAIALTGSGARGQAAPASKPASAPAAATATTAPASTQAKSERPRLGVIGCGGIARFVAPLALKYADMTAVCDVDKGRAAAFNNDFAGGKGFATGDHRKLLDRKDVDVVYIGTPDHWHAKVAADAMRAGKDVYCEKPLTLTIDEGRFLCRVARETGRVVQVGTQQRSEPQFLTAVALAHAGRLGTIRKVTVALGDTPAKGGGFKTAPPPAELDWDRWLGPTPLVDYMPERCHFNFRWWYEYSGGMMTDWGAHHVDIAQWAFAPDLPGPTLVEPLDAEHPVPLDAHGQPTKHDAYNTAVKFQVRCAFANGVEMIVRDRAQEFSEDNGILFEGNAGWLFVNRQTIRGPAHDTLKSHPLPPGAVPALPVELPIPHDRHFADFVACVRERRQPRSDVWSHHRNLTTLHLANIALRLGRKIRWDASAQEIIGDTEANAFQSRPQRKGYEAV